MRPSRSAPRHLHVPRKPWGSEPAGSWSRLESVAKVLAILRAEYRRAVAAERRYEELRHTNASSLTEGRTNRADIARRLFTEIYLYPRETSFMRTHNRVLLAALALCAVMPGSVGRAEAMLEFIQWGAEGGIPVPLGVIRGVEGAAR